MKHLVTLLCVVAVPSLSNAGPAARPFEPENYDAFLETAANQPLNPVEDGLVAHVEERLGVPTFFWAPQRPRVGSSLREMGLSAEEAARQHLVKYAALYRHAPGALAEVTLHRVHDTGKGAVIVSFRKELGGIRVFRDELKVIMTRDLELVALSGYLPPHQQIGVRGQPQSFQLSATTAVTTALFDLTGRALETAQLRELDRVVDGYVHFELRASETTRGLRFSQAARARKVLFTLPAGLTPAYYVELDLDLADGESGLTRMYSYVVSAVDGQILFRKNLTAYDAFSYRVWADGNGRPWDGPHGTAFSPHPTGTANGAQPTWTTQQLITLQNGPISTNDPWLPSGATSSVGNNVDAYADLATPDGFGSGDLRATTVSPNSFDFTYDSSEGPQGDNTQIQAAVTQLFVNNNFFHDWYYDVGFDEASGNAQTDNLGRGGLGNDVLRVEAQDFSGTDNANMATPSDGSKPRMQMYIFSGSSSELLTLTTSNGNSTNYTPNSATFGPNSFDVTADAVMAQDGAGTATDACTALTNASAAAGKIVVIDRGNCTFTVKVKNAQDAGAVGVVIANNQSGGPPPLYGSDSSIVIPSLSVGFNSGSTIKSAVNAGGASIRLFRDASLDRDGTLDNAIVAHEWGHYISNRLIGDANGLNNLQGVGMGEGWGDFHGLLLVVREEDRQLAGNSKYEGVYALSTFVTTGSGGNGLYFGIRRVPYSTDFARNALTFKHIQDGVPLPTTHPVAFGANGAQNSEVHNTGEVWATMLWECYAALLNDPRHTFQQAQDRMKQYLVAGYKGTPNSPTFLEARDAILAAAYANDPDDYLSLAKAFARRGAGQKAVAPSRSSQNNTPVVEDFTVGDQLAFNDATLSDSVVSCDNDGTLDNGETGRLTVSIRNAGANTFTQTTGKVTTTTPGVTILNDGVLTFPPAMPFATTSAHVDVQLAVGPTVASMEFTITYDDPALSGASPEPVKVTWRGNVEETPLSTTLDDVEAEDSRWFVAYNPNLDSTRVFKRVALEPAQHVWFGQNPESPADVYLVSPMLEVAADQNLIIRFKHRYDFEFDADTHYDGAVIEVRPNGGSWTDVGVESSPGYTGTLAPSPSSNPLRGREAFTGKSAGYPDFITETVDLGKAYAGRTIRFRFRIGADDAAAHKGWEIDDIEFSGIVGLPFTKVIAETKVCGNATPVAHGGDPKTVNEREEITLAGSATDADGEPTTLTWTQVEGPAVTLEAVDASSVKFVAPEVAVDTLLVFSLVANDGKENSAPALVEVIVKNVNRAPVATIAAPSSAKPGQAVTLDASQSTDPDGDALTFSWKQTSGPTVSLQGEGAVVSFTVPEGGAEPALTFELTVSDGTATAADIAEIALDGAGVRGGGCGCFAGASIGAAPLWALVAGLGFLFGRRRRR